MKDSFGDLHPAVNFTYFCAVIAFSIIFFRPSMLAASLVGAVLYSASLNGRKTAKYALCVALPATLIIAALNPFVNHRGVTIIGYAGGHPLTQESVFFGLTMGLLFFSVIIWFLCANAVITTDKFVYLFGRIMPELALILSMALRFIPLFGSRARQVAAARAGMGKDEQDGAAGRLKRSLGTLSVTTTWMLESGIDTADSMRSRGYGLAGRTSFADLALTTTDKKMLAAEIAAAAALICAALTGAGRMRFFPMIETGGHSAVSAAAWAVFLVLCLLPAAYNVKEDVKWQRLQQRI